MTEFKRDKNIYLISGLGADERIFQNLDFGALTPIFIKWITPEKDELIQDYALRLTAQIKTEKPIILGVSFGGMLAIEIAKLIDCQEVIIVSSAKNRKEIPFYYRLLGRTNGHKFIPISLFKSANFLTYWFFGMRKKREKNLLKSILNDTDKTFLKWAINAIVNWQNETIVHNLIHIHGASDRVLPIKNKNELTAIIPNGGHLMVFNKASELNKILREILDY
jgi:pimeloyl-ACP methyl ester carboxylesterase